MALFIEKSRFCCLKIQIFIFVAVSIFKMNEKIVYLYEYTEKNELWRFAQNKADFILIFRRFDK